MCESPLVIENGKVQWDRCVKATMDEFEGLQEKGLKLETVEAEETNFGFGFRAKSSDGTEWESGPLDCHEFRKEQKVGRFIDSSSKLIIARKG